MDICMNRIGSALTGKRGMMMPDIEKVITALEDFNKNRFCLPHLIPWDEIASAIALLKKQEAVKSKTIPEELKLKMWNALYDIEDEYEKKFVGKEEHLNWFTVYRPWLQKGFNIAINAIADGEGR